VPRIGKRWKDLAFLHSKAERYDSVRKVTILVAFTMQLRESETADDQSFAIRGKTSARSYEDYGVPSNEDFRLYLYDSTYKEGWEGCFLALS